MVDPVLYVFRTVDGWVVAPFREDVAERPDRDEPARSERETLDRIAGQDVSLILSADGSDVQWLRGSRVLASHLEAMAVCTMR